jgi:formylglycine-generating enzyme required for sulfatase activity
MSSSKPKPKRTRSSPAAPGTLKATASGQARQTNVVVQGNLVTSLAPTDPAPLRAYFEYLDRTSRDIRLSGIDQHAGDPSQARRLQLSEVYVNLETGLMREMTKAERAAAKRAGVLSSRRPALPDDPAAQVAVSALEAAAQRSRLVLTGQPGSGKTTFIRYLCLCLARHGLSREGNWLERLTGAGWPTKATIPVVIELRYFARSLPVPLPRTQTERQQSPQARDLWDFFVQHGLRPEKLEAVAPELERALQDGRALVIFEGLDEVPSGEQRRHVQCAIQRFAVAPAFSASRMLVTCRTRAYAETAIQLTDFPTAPLKDFDEERIRRFCQAWYAELARLEGKAPTEFSPRAQRLFQAIQAPSLRPHAGRPMLLTVMANLHAKSDRLPQDRAQVYAEMVELLVERWDNVQLAEGAPLRRLLEAARKNQQDLIRFLGDLAYAAHGRVQGQGQSVEALADLPKHGVGGLLEQLGLFCGSYDRANELIDAIDHRSGLLVSPDPGSGVYTFPHRSFQEYLAGMKLANEDEFVEQAVNLVSASDRKAASAGYWDEVIRWAAGWIAHVNPSPRLWPDVPSLANQLCERFEREPKERLGLLILAAEVLLEMGLDKVGRARDGGRAAFRVVEQLLIQSMAEAVPVSLRARCGSLVGRLGDPRKGVGLAGDGLPDLDWLEIPPGPFWMGSKAGTTPYDHETPGFKCGLIQEAYRVARFPVTVRQYQAFVRAGGYQERQWWTEAGWEWVTGGKVSGPEPSSLVFDTPNHPQVEVSWFEAKAFCAWLTERLQAGGQMPPHERIDLPSEAQWERAARGTDGREYPWGGRPGDPEPPDLAVRCNYNGSQLGSTSAVGIFPRGLAACEAADLAGNAWEWCRTQWLDSYQNYETLVDDSDSGDGRRVLRGGSWIVGSSGVRCAYRSHYTPDDRYDGFGFRCVWV